MNAQLIDRSVQAVLYEGYILYPYRRSTKNQHRWNFGSLFPREYSAGSGTGDPFMMQFQCLVNGGARSQLSLQVRFLQLVDRAVGACNGDPDSFHPMPELEIDGKRHQPWQEAVERCVTLHLSLSQPAAQSTFSFPAAQTSELLQDRAGQTVGAIRRQSSQVQGLVDCESALQRDGIYRLTVRISNLTSLSDSSPKPSRDTAQKQSLASTHAVVSVTEGWFISLIDPPAGVADLVSQCHQDGAWPVLVGEPGETDSILASPIILYDYPQIAPESPGSLFDGTEIDEILSLRVMTLTDDEKRSAADLDDRAAQLISRTDSLAREQLARLHGVMRPPRPVQAVHVQHAELRAGDRVRLTPRGRADAFDIILRGKTATIVAIEQDFEGRIHLGVTIDDDPGADIGAAGQIGHRFFFRLDEVEPLQAANREVAAS